MTATQMTAIQTESRALTGPFDVTGWDETTYDSPAEGPALLRATVRKHFDGVLAGDSVAELLGTGAGDGGGRGYVVCERFVGTIDGRAGTVVLQHGGLTDGRSAETFGHVVPGSGTGELAGLTGTLTVAVEEGGQHRMTLVVPVSWGR